jgi:excisionase family DNA binding protein
MSSPIKNTLLTPEQVAEILQLHVLTVYSYIRQGKLSAIRLGRSYRVTQEDLEKLIEQNRVSGVKPEFVQTGGK